MTFSHLTHKKDKGSITLEFIVLAQSNISIESYALIVIFINVPFLSHSASCVEIEDNCATKRQNKVQHMVGKFTLRQLGYKLELVVHFST